MVSRTHCSALIAASSDLETDWENVVNVWIKRSARNMQQVRPSMRQVALPIGPQSGFGELP